mgnify:CR=1 FL=1
MSFHSALVATGVGKLVKALKETGQYDNTLIVFGADQGIAWGQKGFQMKLAPYDGTIRGPLIVSMPKKFPQGKVCNKPVGGTDLVPTFFKTAGLELPWKMHGRDLTPLLENPKGKGWKTPLLLAHTGMSYGEDCDVVIDMKDTIQICWPDSLALPKNSTACKIAPDVQLLASGEGTAAN